MKHKDKTEKTATRLTALLATACFLVACSAQPQTTGTGTHTVTVYRAILHYGE